MRHYGFILVPVLIFGGITSAQDVDLRIDRGESGDLELRWTGGIPEFEVHRSVDPSALFQPASLTRTTTGFNVVEDLGDESLVFYRIRSRGDCLQPIGDTFVSSAAPTSPFGASADLSVINGPDGSALSYLKFSLDPLPDTAQILSATLIVQQRGGNGAVGALELKDNWSEASTTFNDRPDLGGIFDQQILPEADGARSFNVTDAVQAWMEQGTERLGLALVGLDFDTSTKFAGREAGGIDAPRLCVQWERSEQQALDLLAQSGNGEQPASTRIDAAGTVANTDVRVDYQGLSPVAAARQYLRDFRDAFRFENPDSELYLDRVRTWEGVTAVRFGRRVAGVPVIDESLLVLVQGSTVLGTSSRLRPAREPVGSFELTPTQAEQVVLDLLPGEFETLRTLGSPPRVWVPDPGDDCRIRPAYHVPAAGVSADGEQIASAVFIDADSGGLIGAVNVDADAGDRPGAEWLLRDAENTGSDICWVFDGKPVWFDEMGARPAYPGSGVDILNDGPDTNAAIADTYRYFFDNHGWGGFGGGGGAGTSYVRWNAPGFNNARFVSFCNIMSYGDGWGTQDIVGHEFAHGVTFMTIPLWPENQPGALNEHFADFFGSQIDGNWELGEARRDGGIDLDGDGTPDPAGPIRDMINPPRFGDPDHMDDYVITSADSGGVHTNNGIPNKAAALLATGGVHRGISVTGIGRDKTADLVFAVMISHMHPWSSFQHLAEEMARRARIFADGGQFGFTTFDACQTINAYASVGLIDPDTDCDGLPNASSDDGDGDGVEDGRDNCPLDPNYWQTDTDGDGIGDRCDTDDDGDGVRDDSDNCPLVSNADQADTDGDGPGDLCDDEDGDGLLDIDDNCPLVPNPVQRDRDGDLVGDVCDNDQDGDGRSNLTDNCPEVANPTQSNFDGDAFGNECDNCPFTFNPDQSDLDRDGEGDACDNDDDGDGIPDQEDNCPVDANPQQLDNDFDGVGMICDADERAFFDGLGQAQELGLVLEHLDVQDLLRIEIFPCTFTTCPDQLDEGFNTTVFLNLPSAYQARIADERGYVLKNVTDLSQGEVELRFDVEQNTFYRDSPNAAPFTGGRRYFLELIAPPDSQNGQFIQGSIRVESSLD